MACLRTGRMLKVEVLGTADRVGMQVLLYGPQSYAFNCSVYSAVTQSSSRDFDVYSPVSKVLALWDAPWNKGIDRDLQKLVSMAS